MARVLKKNPGMIVSARGVEIDMFEIKRKSKRPLKKTVEEASIVKPQQRPVKQQHVTGFMPSMEGVVAPAPLRHKAPQINEPVPPPPTSRLREADTKSLSDYTSIVVKGKEGQQRPDGSAMETAEVTLKEIMGELSAQYGNRTQNDGTRNSRRRS